MKLLATALLACCVLSGPAPAQASNFFPSAVSLGIGVPIAGFAVTTALGAGLSDGARGWYLSGYIAGSQSITFGLSVMIPHDPFGENSVAFWTGVSNIVVGLAALGTAIDNHVRTPKPKSTFGVIPVVLRAPATRDEAPGLVLTGTF